MPVLPLKVAGMRSEIVFFNKGGSMNRMTCGLAVAALGCAIVAGVPAEAQELQQKLAAAKQAAAQSQ